jgi:hypothetical protein
MPKEPRWRGAGGALARGLCVFTMAALGMACSVDLGKLRAPAMARDGGMDTGQAGLAADAMVVDVLPAPLDLPGDPAHAAPDQSSDDVPQVGHDRAWPS